MAGGGARRCSFRGPPQPLPTAATRLLALTGSWAGAAWDFPPSPPHQAVGGWRLHGVFPGRGLPSMKIMVC